MQQNIYAAIDMMRRGDESEAVAVLQHIRNAPSTALAITSISDATTLLPEPAVGDDISSQGSLHRQPLYSGGPQIPKRLSFRDVPATTFLERTVPGPPGMHSKAGDVINVPMKCLPVSKWTRVSTDDKHLTHLLNLFWTWDNTLSRLINRDIFLAELGNESGKEVHEREDTWCCSSFMVNALLAVASMYTAEEAYPARLSEPRGRVFANEAARLLEAQESVREPSLPVIQGLALLWVYEANIGDGNLGLQLLDDVYRLHFAFPFDRVPHPEFSCPEHSLPPTVAHEVKRWQATSQLAWGFYCVAAKIDLTFSRPMRVSEPKIPMPPGDSGSSPFSSQITARSWVAYPVSWEPQASNYGDIFAAECRLARLAEKILLFRDENRISKASPPVMEGIRRLHTKLLAWKQSLPDTLQPSGSELPSVLLLHNTYDALVLKLLEGLPSGFGVEIAGQDPTTLRITHATSLMSGVWTFRALYSLNREYWAMQGCFAAAMAVLEHLSPGSVQVDTFVKACQALAEMGESLPLADSFLNSVKSLVAVYGVTLPRYGSKYLTGRARNSVYTSAVNVSVRQHQSGGERQNNPQGESDVIMTFSELLSGADNSGVEVD